MMLLLLVALLASFAIAANVFSYSDEETIYALVQGSRAFAISMAMWMVVLLLVSFILPADPVYRKEQIIALQDNISAGGVIFLGVGTISGTPSYTYYTGEGNGKELKYINSDNAMIFEDSSQPYILRQIGCKPKYPLFSIACIVIYEQSQIHVPKGTIKSSTSLDAQ
jgi:hypothetical protein